MSAPLDPNSASLRLWHALLAGGASEEEATVLMNGYAHELADRLRNVHGSGDGESWDWWDAATIPASCADLIDPNVGS